jgi:hypothetical protein
MHLVEFGVAAALDGAPTTKMAALASRMSKPPKPATTSAINLVTWAGSDWSARKAAARTPVSLSSATTECARSALAE